MKKYIKKYSEKIAQNIKNKRKEIKLEFILFLSTIFIILILFGGMLQLNTFYPSNNILILFLIIIIYLSALFGLDIIGIREKNALRFLMQKIK